MTAVSLLQPITANSLMDRIAAGPVIGNNGSNF